MTLEEISNRYTIPQNVEALKAILANPRAWKAVDEMFIKTVNELAGRDTLTSDGGKLYLSRRYQSLTLLILRHLSLTQVMIIMK